jgi:hypothetical protein
MRHGQGARQRVDRARRLAGAAAAVLEDIVPRSLLTLLEGLAANAFHPHRHRQLKCGQQHDLAH